VHCCIFGGQNRIAHPTIFGYGGGLFWMIPKSMGNAFLPTIKLTNHHEA